MVTAKTTADSGMAWVMKSSKDSLLLTAISTPTGFPNTVEAVRALEKLGDNQDARKQLNAARTLWRQVIEEADTLANGKYVWYVNVQAVLKQIADRARTKLTGRK